MSKEMIRAYQVIPRDSCDVRANKARRHIAKYVQKLNQAKAEHNNPKYWFYVNLIQIQKQKLEQYRALKEMGARDIFEHIDVKKKYGYAL
jgi:hypothetical protein